MKYKVTYDNNTKIITLLFLIIISYTLYEVFNLKFTFYLMIFLILSIFLFIMYYFPLFIIADTKYITIRTIIQKIKIDKKDVLLIEQIKIPQMSMTLSTKGVFGYLGMSMDDSISFLTDKNNTVLIKTVNSKYLISIKNINNLKQNLNHE